MTSDQVFSEQPEKFAKTSDALVARHDMLSDAKAEWMELEELK